MIRWISRLIGGDAGPTSEGASDSTSSVAGSVPSAVQVTPSAEEDLISSLRRYGEDLRRRQSDEYHAHKASIEEPLQRLIAARRFVTENGLDRALIRTYDEIKYYPAWSKRPDAEKWCAPAFAMIGDHLEGSKTSTVAFIFESTRYRVELDNDRYFDGTRFGLLRLWEVDGLAFAIQVHQDATKDTPHWRLSEVSALRPGPWMKHLLEMEHAIALKHQRYSARTEAERVTELAAGLPSAETLDRTAPLRPDFPKSR